MMFNRCNDDSVYSEAVMMPKENAMINSAYNYGNMCQTPVYEPMQERVCHKQFIHEVPHVCPINTRVINHHIYKHTYTPCYTCCEENEICNVYDNCCNNF